MLTKKIKRKNKINTIRDEKGNIIYINKMQKVIVTYGKNLYFNKLENIR